MMAEKAGLLFMVGKIVKLFLQLFFSVKISDGFLSFWLMICGNLMFMKVTDL